MKHKQYQVTKLCDLRITNMIDQTDHITVAQWALDLGYRLLPLFEIKNPVDLRPRKALEALTMWMEGTLTVGNARKCAFDAHQAAKEATDPESVAIARSIAHACAVTHVKTHAYGAHMYAVLSSMYQTDGDPIPETNWQLNHFIQLINNKN